MGARAVTLTQELLDKICECIELGMSQKSAAQACGIHTSTFYQWAKWGREGIKKGLYSDFADRIKKAQSLGEEWHLANIKKHAEKSWQASAWYLERRFPRKWARKDAAAMIADMVKQKALTKDEISKIFDDVMKN